MIRNLQHLSFRKRWSFSVPSWLGKGEHLFAKFKWSKNMIWNVLVICRGVLFRDVLQFSTSCACFTSKYFLTKLIELLWRFFCWNLEFMAYLFPYVMLSDCFSIWTKEEERVQVRWWQKKWCLSFWANYSGTSHSKQKTNWLCQVLKRQIISWHSSLMISEWKQQGLYELCLDFVL